MAEKLEQQVAADAIEPVSEPSKLDKDALYIMLKDWFCGDQDHSAEWRKQAKEDFGFAAGDQWSPEDKAKLAEQSRPAIVFNRALTIIKAVAGMEISGRHDTVYLPRGTQPGVVKANELLTAASQWMADGCDAEDEQSEAFQDAVVCGMGWTEQRISYDEEPDGMYVEQRVDPLEMYWDRSARAKNLTDARRVFRVRKMSLDEARDFAKALGADVFDEDLDASWAVGADTDRAKAVEERRLRKENALGYSDKSDVYIVHAQWRERRPVYRVADVVTQESQELDEERFSEYEQLMQANGVQYSSVRQTRFVYKQAFLGNVILGDVMEGPCKDRFTFQCITGEKDRNKGTWFGLVRPMRDPQMWANKFLSQTLHILNTTAKGGILAEYDAFQNQREALDTYAQPDAITFTNKGAISGNKIIPKPGAGNPAQYKDLLEYAVSSIRDSVGVNLELLGMRDANQPGILEQQRKQAGMTILATMFDSLRRFRKQVGRVRLHFIQAWLADGRLIRITKDDGTQEAVQLLKEQTLGDYEVIVEDAPNSPNQKQETWQFLMQLMPVFKGMLTPDAAVLMLEYSPLPSKLVDSLKQLVEASKEPGAEQQLQQQLQIEGAKAQINKDDASADASRAKAMLDLANAVNVGAQADLARVQASVVEGLPQAAAPAQPMQQPMPMAPAMPNGAPQFP